MRKMIQIHTIGDANVLNASVKNPPASFYFIEGNVLFLFEYSPMCDEYIRLHKKEFKALKDIILCYTSPVYMNGVQVHHSTLVHEFIEGVFHCIDHHDRIHVRLMTVSPNSNPIIIDYEKQKNVITERNITSQDPNANIVFTNESILFVAMDSIYTKKGYSTITIWKQMEEGYWSCLLHYTGRFGSLNEYTVKFLMEHPHAILVYYINRSFYKSDHNLSVKELCYRIMNTFDDMRNPITLLGFTNPNEAKFIRERM